MSCGGHRNTISGGHCDTIRCKVLDVYEIGHPFLTSSIPISNPTQIERERLLGVGGLCLILALIYLSLSLSLYLSLSLHATCAWHIFVLCLILCM